MFRFGNSINSVSLQLCRYFRLFSKMEEVIGMINALGFTNHSEKDSRELVNYIQANALQCKVVDESDIGSKRIVFSQREAELVDKLAVICNYNCDIRNVRLVNRIMSSLGYIGYQDTKNRFRQRVENRIKIIRKNDKLFRPSIRKVKDGKEEPKRRSKPKEKLPLSGDVDSVQTSENINIKSIPLLPTHEDTGEQVVSVTENNSAMIPAYPESTTSMQVFQKQGEETLFENKFLPPDGSTDSLKSYSQYLYNSLNMGPSYSPFFDSIDLHADGLDNSLGLEPSELNHDIYIMQEDYSQYLEMGIVHENQSFQEQVNGIQQFMDHGKSSAQIRPTESGADGPNMNELGWDGNISNFGL